MPDFNLKYNLNSGLVSVILLLVTGITEAQVFEVDTIMNNGNKANRINIVYIGDGYTSKELSKFSEDAININNTIFSQPPFSYYKSFFNSYIIKVPSNESGAKHPGVAVDENLLPEQAVVNPDNFFKSSFDYASIHRLLVAEDHEAIFNVLADNLPDFDLPLIIVNSPYYGGSGSSYSTSSTDANSSEIAIHEIGHTFAGLADEYWAGTPYAAERSNMTQDNNPYTVKWKNWYNTNDIGIYPYGTTGQASTWFRPHEFCKMQYLGYPFCSVCTEKITDRIHQLVDIVDEYTPSMNAFTLMNANPVSFAIKEVETNPSTVTVNWYLNDNAEPYAKNQSSITVPTNDFNNGENIVKAEVIDNTSLSKSTLSASGYINMITWTVSKSSSLPVHIKKFSGKLHQTQAILSWEVEDNDDLEKFEIEKSSDGSLFLKFATIEPNGNKKHYTYVDQHPWKPYTYYRLKVISKGDDVLHSNVIRLQDSKDKFSYKVYQNPELRKYRLTCTSVNKDNITVTLMNSQGTVLMRKDLGKVQKQLDYDLNLSGKPTGIYFLNIRANNNNYTIKLLAN